MTFSLNLAGAYDSAGVRQWDRSVRLRTDSLELRDVFELDEVRAANQFNFMCARRPDISQSGMVSISVDGEQLGLQYDPTQFVAEVEAIPLPDKRLSDVWGAEVHRVRLKALRISSKGTYRFLVKPIVR